MDKELSHPTMGQFLSPLLSSLIEIHGLESSRSAILLLWDLVTSDSLSLPAAAYTREHSTINGDGIPLQISVSLGKERSGGLRLLAESGPLDRPMRDRILYSRAVLDKAIEMLEYDKSADPLERVLLELLPDREDVLSWMKSGLWYALGFSPKGAGLKTYVNMRWGEFRGRWVRAGRALFASGLPIESLQSWLNLARRWGDTLEPVGFMIDPGRNGLNQVKIYFRAGNLDPIRLRELVRDLNPEFDFDSFERLAGILYPELVEWPSQSLVISYEIDLERWQTPGVKIDIGCGFFSVADHEYYSKIRSFCSTMSFDDKAYADTYACLSSFASAYKDNPEETSEHHQFIGLGHHPREGARLNVYLKPIKPSMMEHDDDIDSNRISAAIIHGAAYIAERKSSDGCWMDFNLPVGGSDEWVTAYVCSILSSIPSLSVDLTTTIQWLCSQERSDGGWGYNGAVPADADSTSWSLIALMRAGGRVSDDAANKLLSYRKANGLYGTYTGLGDEDSWGDGHVDVTAAAALALIEMNNLEYRPLIVDIVRALLSQQCDDGGWNSYWWKERYYAAALVTRAIQSYKQVVDEDCPEETELRNEAERALERAYDYVANATVPAEPFELALWLQAWLDVGGSPRHRDALRCVELLLQQQNHRGKWTTYPMLRLTGNGIKSPWSVTYGGRLYEDVDGIFTTATVIDTLSKYLSTIQSCPQAARKIRR